MKKAYILLLSLLLILGVAGCGLLPQPSAPPPEIDEQEQEVEVIPPTDVVDILVDDGDFVAEEIEEPTTAGEITPPKIMGYAIPNEFSPDWGAIAQRAAELTEFFETNLATGISLEDAIRELGVEPVRVWHDTGPGIIAYTFELMTGPSYVPFSDTEIFSPDNMGMNHEWLTTGYIGVSVIASISYDRREDFFENVSVSHGVPDGQVDHTTITIFMRGSDDVVVFVSHHDVFVNVS